MKKKSWKVNGYKIRHKPLNSPDVPEGMKWCPVCEKIKPIALFSRDYSRKNGIQSYCLTCKAYIMREWRKSHKLTKEQRRKANARSYAFTYLKRGKLKKPELCEECGWPGVIQIHHSDYSKPLDVEWLCKRCHKLRHRKVKGVGT